MQNLKEHIEALLGERVLTVLRAGEDSIVLLDPGTEYPELRNNLLRLQTEGLVVWRINPPSSTDMFVEVDLQGDKLVAWSWESYFYCLDPATGQILESTLTK